MTNFQLFLLWHIEIVDFILNCPNFLESTENVGKWYFSTVVLKYLWKHLGHHCGTKRRHVTDFSTSSRKCAG